MSANFAQLAANLRTASTEMQKTTTASVAKAAELVRAGVAVASGGYAASNLTRTKAYLRPTSAMVAMTSRRAHLLDRDTRPHLILPGAQTGRRGRKRALLVNGQPVAAANHPGTRGKHMWEIGVALAAPKVDATISDGISAALQKAFLR